MKDVWILSVITSLPEVCMSFRDMKSEYFAFENFEKAKEAFRAKIKEFAFSKNGNRMFDEKGNLLQFEKYAEELNDEFDDELECLSRRVFTQILKALSAAFRGENTELDIEDGFYTDWMIAVDIEDNSINLYGYDDGPFNGYDPILRTNIFSMEKESDYYLHIDDMFAQETSAEFYMDLRKIVVE